MGHDFSSDERYQTDHGRSPVIDAKDKRIAELEALAARALRAVDAGAGSRQWEKIDDARAILREALGT